MEQENKKKVVQIEVKKANLLKTCLQCGRTFRASNNKHPFCSTGCKMRYSNYRGFNCSQCRNASCELRNNSSHITPNGCPNYKWNY